VAKMKKMFIICKVRNADEEYKRSLEEFVKDLEENGYKVHLPHRDTNQEARGFDICLQNKQAIQDADEIAVFYSSDSQGIHFDLGMAFALNKKIIILKNELFDENKSFPRMIWEWSKEQK
jgi:hypothetical protein